MRWILGNFVVRISGAWNSLGIVPAADFGISGIKLSDSTTNSQAILPYLKSMRSKLIRRVLCAGRNVRKIQHAA
jgi:hypothetical protein